MLRRKTLILLGVITGLLAAWAAALVLEQRQHQRERIARVLTGGEPARAPALLRRYGCTGCHTVAGLPDADGAVGPALENLRERVFIGGHLPNNAENLVHWIMTPQSLSRSAMPDSGITEPQARDVAAYLYAH